jgi:hypothetical protein
MKRVVKATIEARDELKTELGKRAFDNLPEEQRKAVRSWEMHKMIEELGKEEMKKLSKTEKRELSVNAFMRMQAKELLLQVSMNKSVLTEEQIKEIVDLGLTEELDRANAQAQRKARILQATEIERNFELLLSSNKDNGWPELDPMYVEQVSQQWLTVNPDKAYSNPIKNRASNYNSTRQSVTKYQWLLDYKGTNQKVLDIRHYLSNWGYISSSQESYAKTLISNETNPPQADVETSTIFQDLNTRFQSVLRSNSFLTSVEGYFNRNGFITEKQKIALKKIYEGLNK